MIEILALLSVIMMIVLAALVPNEADEPASHAVAHAEGWPCSCPGRRQ